MIEPLLAEGVGDIAIALRDRFGAGQPIVDVVGERLVGVGDIALDLGLSSVEGIHPRQQPLFEDRARLWIELGPERVLNDGGLGRAGSVGRLAELGVKFC